MHFLQGGVSFFSKNVTGIASLEVVLAALPAIALHFDDPRRLVGGDLQLSAIVRLRNPRKLLHTYNILFHRSIYTATELDPKLKPEAQDGTQT